MNFLPWYYSFRLLIDEEKGHPKSENFLNITFNVDKICMHRIGATDDRLDG